jgi:hypothetical protein
MSDLTVANEWREYQSYQVLSAGTTPDTWSIPGMKVVPTVPGCPFETVVKYETKHGYYEELKENDYIKLNLDAETMTVDLTVTQELYLDKLVPAFGTGAAGYIDDQIYINVEVISKDNNGNEVVDSF